MIYLNRVKRRGKCGGKENDGRANRNMLALKFSQKEKKPLTLLCLGAHSDDIEIGCGGSVLRIFEEYPEISVYWVVFSANTKRRKEAKESANLFLAKASRREIVIKNFKESFFPYEGEEIKGFFEALKKKISPDIIFTHYRNDLHQDHRLISELTWNSYRDHLILEYEVIKYDGDLGAPNFFVHLDDEICGKKIDFLMDSFKTQANRDWFTPDTFLSMLRIRGVESRAPERYAEGFYCRKIIL